MTLVLVTVSCGPRRYKCGPYRKCENTIEKTKKSHFNNEFYKNQYCYFGFIAKSSRKSIYSKCSKSIFFALYRFFN